MDSMNQLNNQQQLLESNQFATRLQSNQSQNKLASGHAIGRPQNNLPPSSTGIQINTSLGLINSRWPFNNPYSTNFVPAGSPNSNSTYSTGAVNNLSNSNNMIGPDGDNQQSTNTTTTTTNNITATTTTTATANSFSFRKKNERQPLMVPANSHYLGPRSHLSVKEQDSRLNIQDTTNNLNNNNQLLNLPFSSHLQNAHEQHHILNNIDKGRSSSPNDSFSRSHHLTNIPLQNKQAINSGHLASLHNFHGNTMSASLTNPRVPLPPAHSRSSPYSSIAVTNLPMTNSTKLPPPPRPHSVTGAVHHNQELPFGHLSSSMLPPRQPPAAHQSSTARSSLIANGISLGGSQSSLNSCVNNIPVTAHLSSKTPVTPRLQAHDNIHAINKPEYQYNDRQLDERIFNGHPTTMNGSSGNFKAETDTLSGLPLQALLNIKQQQELALKRLGSGSYIGPGLAHQNTIDAIARLQGSLETTNSQPLMTHAQAHMYRFQTSNINPTSKINNMTRTTDSLQTNQMPPPLHPNDQRNNDSAKLDQQNFNSVSNQMGIISFNDNHQQGEFLNANNQLDQHPTSRLDSESSSSSRALSVNTTVLTNTNPQVPWITSDSSITDNCDLQQNPSPRQNAQRSIITGTSAFNSKKGMKKPKQNLLPSHLNESKMGEGSTMIVNSTDLTPNVTASNLGASERHPESATQLDVSTAPPLSYLNGNLATQSLSVHAIASSTVAEQTNNGLFKESVVSETQVDNNIDGNSLQPESDKISIKLWVESALQSINQPIENSQKLINTVDSKETIESGATHNMLVKNSIPQSIINEPATSLSQTESIKEENPTAEPSKYQKMYTKKAWLKNYDQEDQARTENAQPVEVVAEKRITKIENPALTVLSSDAHENVKMEVQDIKPTKADIKKKARETTAKKANNLPRSSKLKAAITESDGTNTSTSDLDESDETLSLESVGEMGLRKMPRRKVKPDTTKESPSNVRTRKPRDASNKKTATKGKVTETRGKRARELEDDSRKSKKQKLSTFLQTDSCYEIVPKNIRCLECRRVRQSSLKADKSSAGKQSSRTTWDDFCRFYEFRKLKYTKTSQIVVAGFSEVSDAKKTDTTLWLPNSSNAPKNMNLKIAKYILSNIGNNFCSLVQSERAAHDSYFANPVPKDKKITWKKVVNGFRELCDVCATTLFNYHYVCEQCGFVVCLDCHQERAKLMNNIQTNHKVKDNQNQALDSASNMSLDEPHPETADQNTPSTPKKSKRDSCGWAFCSKNEEHSHEMMTLSQIIPGDCLETIWRLLHEVREKYNLGRCVCQENSLKEALDDIGCEQNGHPDRSKIEESDEEKDPHSTLKDLLLSSSEPVKEEPKTQESASNSVCLDSPEKRSVHNHDEISFIDDTQEDLKLAELVSAAIDACISSIPNCKSDLSESSPYIVDEDGGSLGDINGCNQKNTTHLWLCNNDLLVLTEARHKNNAKLFKWQWKQGKPVIVRGVDKLMQVQMWLPQFFSKEFGDYRSDLVDCRNGDIYRHSMKKYWEGFEPTNISSARKRVKDDSLPSHITPANNEECSNGPSYYSGSALWRLKDWPPGQDFNEILPLHYEDFMGSLPLSSYTTRKGKLNLACRLPEEMLKPDLGPKMYSAYGTSKFPERGTTNLHLDVSDAINVMVYVSGATSFYNGSTEAKENFEKTINECSVDEEMKREIRNNKKVPGALWHVFKPSDARKVRAFLNKIADERDISLDKRTDPIHDQTWYMDQVLLDRLSSEYGVDSYAILQCMGDAILIPAGAPHQVKNLQNCIKVANDFVSPENVRYCLQLTSEFRNLPETHINQEDKLQVKNILYHSVKESLQYIKLYEAGKLDLSKKSGDEDDGDGFEEDEDIVQREASMQSGSYAHQYS